jgi:UDP-galactopyranose mutase
VIEKRPHVGGNVYCEKVEGIYVHKYGPHVFHTNDKEIWNYVNNLVEFNQYELSIIANYHGELYNLPFNMNTFYKIYGGRVKTPDEAKAKIADETKAYVQIEPSNLEEQALKLVGRDVYEKLIKGYTEKQWGKKATELPAFIIKRIPLRFTYNNNYFDDKYQGVPTGGYASLIEKLLEKADVKISTDFFDAKNEYESIADKIVYTGMIDEYFDYCYGNLEYRSLRFEHVLLDKPDFQGNAIINYTDIETPYTRIVEHKHFEFGKQKKTVITKEYPEQWERGKDAYYPVNDAQNNKLFEQYKQKAASLRNVIWGGRLADYAYYDMDKIIRKALDVVKMNL